MKRECATSGEGEVNDTTGSMEAMARGCIEAWVSAPLSDNCEARPGVGTLSEYPVGRVSTCMTVWRTAGVPGTGTSCAGGKMGDVMALSTDAADSEYFRKGDRRCSTVAR